MHSTFKCPCQAANHWKQKLMLMAWLVSLSATGQSLMAQHRVLDVGIRIQKSIGLYYENGFMLQYSSDALAAEKLYFGLSFVSSRLGTALGTNAIKQDSYLLSTSYFFRPARLIRPLVRLNIGYFSADLEEAVFAPLPHASLLLSSEGGICIEPALPLKLTASLGYNLISGDGVNGPGTLYPLFIQTSLSWNIFYYANQKQ